MDVFQRPPDSMTPLVHLLVYQPPASRPSALSPASSSTALLPVLSYAALSPASCSILPGLQSSPLCHRPPERFCFFHLS